MKIYYCTEIKLQETRTQNVCVFMVVVVVFRYVKFKHMAQRVQLLCNLTCPIPPHHRVTGCLMSNAGI